MGRSLLLAGTNTVPQVLTIRDQSPNPKTINFQTTTSPTVSTTVSRIGSSSILFDGTSWARLNGQADFAFGTGPYTIEAYVNYTTIAESMIYDGRNTGGGPFLILWLVNGKFNYWIAPGNLEGTTVPVTGTWYHVALCRTSNTTRLFVNGTQESSFTDNGNYTMSANRPYICADDTGGRVMKGYIHMRVTKASRYSSNFTPPSDFPTNSTDDPLYNSVSLLLRGGS